MDALGKKHFAERWPAAPAFGRRDSKSYWSGGHRHFRDVFFGDFTFHI
jgi:hypothetical protein